ncbi:MAG: helix-turn-helix transcriptional regulator [bacterium]|nr:helix-turn-helix transcriptional regulator [bacterium]
MPTQSRSHTVDSTTELRALASPARQEFLAGLHALQPCTMGELGEHLGRLPVSLYYHLRKLEAVGLVIEHGKRATDNGTETLYALRAKQVRVDPAQRTGANLEALRKIGAGIFRFATRLHDAAVAQRPNRQWRRREHILSQRTLQLDARGLERLNGKIAELLDLLEEPCEGDGTFYTVTLHLAPNHVRGPRT